VLLLDEPLSNLDARLRVQTREELVRLQQRLGITTILVTHDQDEALTTCSRIAVLDQGMLQQVGTPVELFDEPANRFVAQFIGSVNLFPGRAERTADGAIFRSSTLGPVTLPPGMVLPDGPADLAFRPHAASFSTAPDTAPGIVLAGAVEHTEFQGTTLRYRITVGEATVVADIPKARGALPLVPGTPVRLHVPAGELRFVTD